MRLLLLLLAIISNACAYKYLVVSPIYSYSHIKFMSNIADILADHGHEVVVFQQQILAMWRNKKVIKNQNVKIWDYEANEAGKEYYRKRPKSTVSKFWTTNQGSTPADVNQFAETMTKDLEHMCLQVFEDTLLHEKLKAQKFDVIISEPFDPCGLYLGDFLQIPSTIVAMASSRTDPVQWSIGQPSNVNFVPGPDSKYGDASSIWDRFNNFWMYLMRTSMFRKVYWNILEHVREKTGHKIRDINEVMADCAFLFYNSHPYLDFPYPSIPKYVPIGGFSMNVTSWKTDKLPQDLNEILDKREKTVYISFGSVIRSVDLPDTYKDGLVETFKSMPDVTFIWKYEDEYDEKLKRRLPGNVHLRKWLPQTALLVDSRVSLFVTHGGLGSVMETSYSGKPAVVVPLFFDQPMNAEMMARHGGSEVFSKFDLEDSHKFSSLLRTMLENPEYRKKSDRLSQLLQKQPIDPVQRLVRHAEFAAEFQKLPELDPYSRQLSFVQFYFLDILTLALVFLLSCRYVISSLCKHFLSPKPKTE